jgi:hypothetical protein
MNFTNIRSPINAKRTVAGRDKDEKKKKRPL